MKQLTNISKSYPQLLAEISDPRSAGPNYLLKMGAVPVTDAHDVISILGIEIDQSNRMRKFHMHI